MFRGVGCGLQEVFGIVGNEYGNLSSLEDLIPPHVPNPTISSLNHLATFQL
jgi:hypothetical protein